MTCMTYERWRDTSMKAPKGKHIFGMVTVGQKGQIVIPKKARDVFDIKPGDSLMLVGDESSGLGIITSNKLTELFSKAVQEEKK
jgi:AbrB family looped-hinge helix DNA binding protein